ncbi:MAG TPA: winged helix DNA-binding domain-containing protein, partial [Ktedonobacterales bacterium]|nr:winged helix DNA-binding domain-containing protein [Ktedonobacterales bacterium]
MSAYSLSPNQIRLLRLRAQHLAPRLAVGGTASAIIGALVSTLGGVQAQEAPAAALAICVRSLGLGVADIERARVVDRSVVRLWAMRNTLHLVAAADLGWLLPLLGPIFIAGSRRRYAQLGLDEATCANGVRAIRELLAAHGPLTRAELVARLASDYHLRLEGQMTPHLIARAALDGYLCLGPDRGAKPTYALLDDWLGGAGWRDHTLPRDEAATELARRHLGAYAPATPEDFAAWSGLPMSEARAAWRRLGDQLIEVEADGRPMWMLATQAEWLDDALAGTMRPVWETPLVRLLPAYDASLLGYRKRDLL